MLMPNPSAHALQAIKACDVTWQTPSADAAGSMPIGNGVIVLHVWVEKATGDLVFYIARTDALSEVSRILKLGAIRVHLGSDPFKNTPDFRQRLNLTDGTIEVSGSGARLILFVDSGSNTVQVRGESSRPVRVSATVECWRNDARAIPDDEQASAWSGLHAPFPLIESADHFPDWSANSVIWYHRNETSLVPKLWQEQSLTGLPGTFDPLIHRTFGGELSGTGFTKTGPRTLATPAPTKSFGFCVATATGQTNDPDIWRRSVESERDKSNEASALARTKRWWHSFWQRSWVVSDSAPKVMHGYVLQRFVQACQGRGTYPIKFNGGYYTVEPKAMGKPFNADWRNWGDAHWWQNVRHMYHPMLASGDTEMMEPLFRLYESALPLAESRAKAYHGASGAYFPETMTVFGTYAGGDYGWDRTGHQPKDVLCPWWQYAWNQGPELVALMLDRWDYTEDRSFLQHRVLPMADAVLAYFDTRFHKDARGKIVLDPTQVVETYWEGVVNDMPSTAGLIAITDRLCLLPKGLVSESRQHFYARMRAACPDLPIQQSPDGPELAPAQKYVPKTSNVENGELYAAWPFRLVCLNHPVLLKEAKTAYARRLNHLDVGWGYDGNVAALLGMTDEAARILMAKCENSNPAYRWPATWGPNFDWLPDQNHGGNLLNTANLMLLQASPLEQGGALRILPSWPKGWDVDFKLHAPGKTTVRCVARNGKIELLEVTPAHRTRDVILPAGWDVSALKK